MDSPIEQKEKADNPACAKILIVDDNEEFLLMLERMLADQGYDVVKASNGDKALRYLRKNPADLIITDIVMPEKDGLEVLQELRRQHARLKVIAISGGPAGNSAWLPIAKDLGAIRVLKKPFRKDELVTIVKEVLESDEVTPGYWLSFEPL